MPSDLYRNLAEILDGTVSLIDHYQRRMTHVPPSLPVARTALMQAIAELELFSSRAQSED